MEALKANELRCGNLVTVNNPEYHPAITGQIMVVVGVESWRNPESIDLIFQDKRNFSTPAASQWIEFIEGIPITEDWLIRGGAIKHESSATLDEFYSISYGTNGVAIVFFDKFYGKFCYRLGTGHNRVLDYVHQLQGLHFYVTGTELQFKPIK